MKDLTVEMGESSHSPYQGFSWKPPCIGQVSLAELYLLVLRFADLTTSCHRWEEHALLNQTGLGLN